MIENPIIALWLSAFVMASLTSVVEGAKCQAGVVLPVWVPQENLGQAETAMRGLAYFLAMIYMFLGVSIISDRFMAAIEVITSKEKEIKVKMPSGGVQIVVARVWNETVANLTLMALGSSAPEILLSIIEIMGKLVKGDFESGSGELGPGTIVGSAAFNLLCIIAICVYVIPDGQVRSIKHLNVFFVTATWSVFAYIWLFLILKVISPGVVEIWEGVLTFSFFPLTVGTAYFADQHLYKYLSKKYRLDKRGVIVAGEGGSLEDVTGDGGLQIFPEEAKDDNIRNFEQTRRDYIQLLRNLRRKFPGRDPEELEQLTKEEILKRGPKSRAFYRMQATRKLISALGVFRKSSGSLRDIGNLKGGGGSLEGIDKLEPHATGVYFNPAHYTVMESVESFEVTVVRRGDLTQIVLVDYKTEDGSATADSDYVPVNGTLTFFPGETKKGFRIKVMDDDIYEEDEHFYIHLSRARFGQPKSMKEVGVAVIGLGSIDGPDKYTVHLMHPSSATVMILDDDHSGVFNISDKDVEVPESIGQIEVRVKRWSGSRGKVQLSYSTVDGTAKAGKEYEAVHGKLVFLAGEIEKSFQVTINQEDSYQKDVLFYVQISHPTPFDANGEPLTHTDKRKDDMSKAEIIAARGWPKLGPDNRAQIRIRESKEFKSTVDKLLQRANAKLVVGTSSWKEQFIDAVTVGGGDSDDGEDDDDDDGDETDEETDETDEDESDEVQYPSFWEYFMHFLTIFWKVLFACVPPTDMCGGYLAFFVSILAIGVLTAIIGDLAAHFGCTVGLKDSVTAITFVALGTSIPDTFASKVAAVQDEYADASIGNVTGSNAVNVFLGIGIAWTIASVAYALRTCSADDCNKFKVDPGSLAFSVTLFCTCAVVAIAVILIRRLKVFGGGELGGPARFKYSTALLFIALWIFYILMSSLEAYDKVQGF